MADWLKILASHIHSQRQRYPGKPMMVVFDIDGTILDLSYSIEYCFKEYDRTHQTQFFKNLNRLELNIHENYPQQLLQQMNIPYDKHEEMLGWYWQILWSEECLKNVLKPYPGVLEVIRWLQSQEAVTVGLNTGRPERMRQITLQTLNSLGKPHCVEFFSHLLFMNPNGWHDRVSDGKIEGIRYFKILGYQIVAMLDNEPVNLRAIADMDPHKEILLMHADTLYESDTLLLPANAVRGQRYDIKKLQSSSVPAF
ncbi:HAD hydrolase-like protein [candidate division KSB1 bacterium]|nr:HAD hydrolase-like protein [candidate division KSB1 bacterium]